MICGILCLTVRRRVGLWCCWTVYVLQQMYWTYATGISWQLIRWTPVYEPQMNYMRLAIAWVMAAARVALVVYSACSFRKARLPAGKRTVLLLAAGWAAFLCVQFVFGGVLLGGLLLALVSCLSLAAVTALLIATLAVFRGRRRPVDDPPGR